MRPISVLCPTSEEGAWAHSGESPSGSLTGRHRGFASPPPHAPADGFMLSYGFFFFLLSLPLAVVCEYFGVPTYSMVS